MFYLYILKKVGSIKVHNSDGEKYGKGHGK